MNTTIVQTGTKGLIKLQDNTDGNDKTVDLYVSSSSAISIPSLPWSYSIDGVLSDTKSFKFVATTAWQHLGKIYVGYAETFIFHLGNTGHAELGGPTDATATLQNSTKVVNINVNGTWEKAIPYVNVNGVWTEAVPYVAYNSVWTETT